MSALFQDLKYGARLLTRHPGFTLVAVLSLALGIGANTAIFSLVRTLLFSPFPADRASELVSVFTTDQRNPGNLPMSHLNFKDYRDQNESLSGLAAFTFAPMNLMVDGSTDQVLAQVVTGNYFDVLGVRPAHGRTFQRHEDEKPGAYPVAVVSHGLWERQFGADPSIVGREITLNRQPFTVVGVAPSGFTGTFLFGAPDLWVPMAMHDVAQPGFDWYETRRGLFLFVFGRLRAGVPLAQAQANLGTIGARLEAEYPNDNRGRGVNLLPLLEARVNPDGQNQIAIVSILLTTVVGVVLLVACANIANLLLTRAAGRRREIAMRLALGARRARLVRQLLTESVLLALAGGALGLLVAFWTLDLLRSLDGLPLPQNVQNLLGLDAQVLLFTLVLAVLTGLLFGLAPAVQATRPDVLPALKQEGVPSDGSAPRGFLRWLSLRHGLVISQVALSLIALVAAGLFLRSLRETQRIDPGFETDAVLMAAFNLGREGYTPERGLVFHRQAIERVAGLPGVRATAISQDPPFGGFGFSRSVFLEGATSDRDRTLVQVNVVTPEYFATLGIPIVRGRGFTGADDGDSLQVVVVNETMANRFWPSQEAVGRRFRFFGDEAFTTVVGVARDAKYNGLVEDPLPFIYQPMRQEYTPAATLLVRTAGDASRLAAPVRAAIGEIDRQLTLLDVQTVAAQVDRAVAPQRLMVGLLSSFGALALALAAVGLYGVASYAVSQRTREIGIRMALGARRGDVLRLVVGQGMRLVGVGVLLGLGVAFAAAREIATLIVGVSPHDPLTFAGTAAALAAVAAVATYVPARRATRIDPIVALRYE